MLVEKVLSFRYPGTEQKTHDGLTIKPPERVLAYNVLTMIIITKIFSDTLLAVIRADFSANTPLSEPLPR